uniref:Uncharacterized protein n=1 Tax=Arundo donax TaxID=35708 RepID=A0A0A9ENE0_ARUDO
MIALGYINFWFIILAVLCAALNHIHRCSN